ncbi:MAG: YdcF family protein [Thermogutta sp.]
MSRRWVAVLVVLGVVGGLAAAHQWWLPHLASWLDVSGPVRRADYAMVMGGGVENRPVLAAVLYRKRWVDRILISEIRPIPSRTRPLIPAEHELTKALLMRLGVPEDRIVLLQGNHAATFHEITSLRDVLAESPSVRVIIVTDSLHTRRTAWSVRHLLGPMADRVTFVGAPSERYDLRRWWQSGDGFFMVTSEYLKLFSYWILYGRGKWWVPGVIALILALGMLRCHLTRYRRTHRLTQGTA